MIFIYLTMICANASEIGFIYSVGARKFLGSYENKIRMVDPGAVPGMFERKEMGEGYSGSLLIYPYPKTYSGETPYVADLRLNHSEFHLWPEHKNWNQQIKFSEMPGGDTLKMVVGDVCLEVEGEKLIGATCKASEDDQNQLFKWFPEYYEGKITKWALSNSRRLGRKRRHSYNNKYSLPGEEDDSDDWERDRYGKRPRLDDTFGRNDYNYGGRGFHGGGDGGFPGGGRGSRDFEYPGFTGNERYDEYSDAPEDQEPRGRGKRGWGSSMRMSRRRRASFSSSTDSSEDSHPYMDPIGYGSRLPERRGRPRAVVDYRHPSGRVGMLPYGKVHCNPGDPGDREICGINRTAAAFRLVAGVPV